MDISPGVELKSTQLFLYGCSWGKMYKQPGQSGTLVLKLTRGSSQAEWSPCIAMCATLNCIHRLPLKKCGRICATCRWHGGHRLFAAFFLLLGLQIALDIFGPCCHRRCRRCRCLRIPQIQRPRRAHHFHLPSLVRSTSTRDQGFRFPKVKRKATNR